MTRLAILSDVHADVHALRDALLQIDRLGCDHLVCAGDIVDYGSFPEETIELLVERRVPTIRGNHDRWAMQDGRAGMGTRIWELPQAAQRFLRRLPTSWSARIEGVRIAVHHARPGNDMHGIEPNIAEASAAALLEAAACDVLIAGHTHVSFERHVTGGRLVCNPGALLRDPVEPHVNARGTFGVLELPSCELTVREARTGNVVAHRRDGSSPVSDFGQGLVLTRYGSAFDAVTGRDHGDRK
jgi:putative phosphoesterase